MTGSPCRAAAGARIADRYQLGRRIAVGGMGEVWEAEDIRLGRSVAVKVLRPELSDDPEFLHRFRIEARTVASLDHSGIAAVFDYGEDDGPSGHRTAYLVMELVRGEPLSSLIARGPLDPEQTLRIMEQAARALQAAHERGYVHRDVKPGNILIRADGKVKLTDFGIAKAADAVPVTRSGMVMGTAHYIAPEQASGAEAGPAGDVYSLGIVGYECLAGHRPFRAESAVAVAMMQVREPPPPLPDSVPAAARELIDAVLVKDPARRYGTGRRAGARGRRRPPRRPPADPRRPAAARVVAAHGGGRDRRDGLPAPHPRLRPGPPSPHRAAPRSRPPDWCRRARRPTGCSRTPPPAPARSGRCRATVTGRPRRVHPRSARAQPRRITPTEPLRIPPAAGPAGGVLLVLFVLLTLAAVALGVFLLRGGLDDIAGAAAAATVIVSPLAGSVASRDASAPGDPRRNRHR